MADLSDDLQNDEKAIEFGSLSLELYKKILKNDGNIAE